MENFPLFFKFETEITVPDFKAKVIAEGRVLLEKNHGEWWFNGVNPGSMTGGGSTFEEGFAKFKTFYNEILVDLAEEATSFANFKDEVVAFLKDVDTKEATRWEEARAKVRAGAPIEERISLLKRITEDQGYSVKVDRLDIPKPVMVFAGSLATTAQAANENLELAA